MREKPLQIYGKINHKSILLTNINHLEAIPNETSDRVRVRRKKRDQKDPMKKQPRLHRQLAGLYKYAKRMNNALLE